MSVDGINIPALGVTKIYPIGVNNIGITGQAPISGNVDLIPSGQVQMAYSGNNIVIGMPPPQNAAAIFPFSTSATIVSGEGSNTATQYAVSSGNVIVMGNKMATIFTSGNAVANSFASSNQFNIVSGFSMTGAIMRGFTMSNSGTLQYTGADPFYGTVLACAGILQLTNTHLLTRLVIGKNGVVQPTAGPLINLSSNGDLFSTSLMQGISLNTNDTVDLRIMNGTNTSNITVDSYNFTIN